ncbi:MAG: hypothetical protein ACRDF4_08215 [Rhabdochlamydiaceae bacterium]
MALKNGCYWIRSCKCIDLIKCQSIAEQEIETKGKTCHLEFRNRGYESMDVATLLVAARTPNKQRIRIYNNRSDTIVEGAIKNNMKKVAVIRRGYKIFDLKSNRNRRHIEFYPLMTFRNLMNSCFPTEPYTVGDQFVDGVPIHQNLTQEFKDYYDRVKKYNESPKHPRQVHGEDKVKRSERNRRHYQKHKEDILARQRQHKLEQREFNAAAERLPHSPDTRLGLVCDASEHR